MIYQFISDYRDEHSVENMCRVLKVSRSCYYRWRKGNNRVNLVRKFDLETKIEELYLDYKQLYGSPRLRAELEHKHSINVSQSTVANVMRARGLRSKLSKKFVVTTDSSHSDPIADNIVDRDFKPDAPNKVWVSDITYLKTSQDFIYLTTVMDLYDRQIIGWTLSNTMDARSTTIAAFNNARKNRPIEEGLIFHSDRGIQYACSAFVNVMNHYGVTRSMSRKGNCWDNAVAESFFKSLKTEAIYGYKLRDKAEMRSIIFEYIEIWYNKKRRHSFLNYLTIEEFNAKGIEYFYKFEVA